MINTILKYCSLIPENTEVGRKDGTRQFQVQGATLHGRCLNLEMEQEEGNHCLAKFYHFCCFPSGWLHTTQILKKKKKFKERRKRLSKTISFLAGKLVKSP